MVFINAVRGLCMALADSVPGVSGGTIAFLLGFYDRFIASLDDLLHGKKQERIVAFKFLLQLGIGWIVGMTLAILVLTEIFESHIYAISSLFIGFILFAIPLVIHEEKATLKGQGKWIFYVLIGVIFVVAVSSFNPISAGGVGSGLGSLLYVYVGGIIAISAMVLPGISGSTLLLIMGLYIPVLSAVRSLMGLDFSALSVVVVFALGVVSGAALVIHLLRYLMSKYRAQMIFLIIGLMLGSIYSVILGPTTLDIPKDAMTWETFSILFFLLGGAVIFGLQATKAIVERKIK